MIQEERCPNGAPKCDYREAHELTLVGTIMHAIEHHNKTEDAECCPACLRDALLAVAALLHVEAVRLNSANGGETHTLEADFANAACQRLADISEAMPMPVNGFKH